MLAGGSGREDRKQQDQDSQVDKVLVILTGDTSFRSQRIHSSVNDFVSMQHGKVSCILVVNGDMHLFRELDDSISPCHVEGAFWILYYLVFHEMIPSAQ